MKTNWKLLICGMLSYATFAQENTYTFSLTDKDKKIEISSGTPHLKLIGYSGKDIIISSETGNYELPEEAKGLKQVIGGLVENTGNGANISRKEDMVRIRIPKSAMYQGFIIKVPQDLNIKIKEFNNNYCDWYITDIKGEVEAKSSYSSITVDKVTGPLIVHSQWGRVKVTYDKLNQDKPNAIFSNKEVDVTLPADTKATLALNSTWGSVFTDFDIVPKEIEEEDEKDNILSNFPKSISSKGINQVINTSTSKSISSKSEDNKSYTIGRGGIVEYDSENCNCEDGKEIGTINGGGVKLSLRSDHGMVYLKKKK